MFTKRISFYKTYSGQVYKNIPVQYKIYGNQLHSAPVVVVFHSLTANSDIISEKNGWWKHVVGFNKLIDFKKYTVLSVDIIGNGSANWFVDKPKDFVLKDIARLNKTLFDDLKIEKIHTIIGGSIGGGLVWELAFLFPNLSTQYIPIASSWKSSDWLKGFCFSQEQILLHSKKPLEDARKVAMLFYRNSKSINNKFRLENSVKKQGIISWLNFHGESLKARYNKQAYLFMNHLLATINAFNNTDTESINRFKQIASKIIQLSIKSDLLFTKEELQNIEDKLNYLQVENTHLNIESEDGHDAFLIEQEQIAKLLAPYF